jgi:hypothetical protein
MPYGVPRRLLVVGLAAVMTAGVATASSADRHRDSTPTAAHWKSPFAAMCASGLAIRTALCRTLPGRTLPGSTRPAHAFPGHATVAGAQGSVAGAQGPNPGPAGQTLPCLTAAGVNDRCETWGTAYSDSEPFSGSHGDAPAGLVTNPAGTRVFMADTAVVDGSPRMTVAAFDASSGREVWVAHARPNPPTVALAIAISPNGAFVVVTGYENVSLSINQNPYFLFLTNVYSAQTGKLIWSKTYIGLGGQANAATQVAISPDSRTAYVSGVITIPGPFQRPPANITTIAYNVGNGKIRWAARFNGESGLNIPDVMTLSARGDMLFIAGQSQYRDPSPSPVFRYVTLAYSTRNGRERWERYYNGYQDGNNQPLGIGVDGRGSRVFVTGAAQYSGSISAPIYRYQTLGYDVRTGRALWSKSYVAKTGQSDAAEALRVSPDGRRVYVTGSSTQPDRVQGQALPVNGTATTIAYDSASGKQRWMVHASPGGLSAVGTTLAVSKSDVVYAGVEIGVDGPLAGTPGLIAYQGSTGAQKWIATYEVRDPSVTGIPSAPIALSINPRRGTVYQLDSIQTPVGIGEALACPTANHANSAVHCTAESPYPLILAYAP